MWLSAKSKISAFKYATFHTQTVVCKVRRGAEIPR